MTREMISSSVQQAIRATEFLQKDASLLFIENAAKMIVDCFQRGNKVLIAGNGGSLCDAMHFAEELTGFFRQFRPALPAIALSDPSHLTCVSNDIGFEWVFSRAVEALGKSGDIFVGMTTSGNSPNIINAVNAAKRLGIQTITFLGKGGGKLRGEADLELSIDGFSTSDRIQEAHMAAIHIIIEAIELELFPSPCGSSLEEAVQAIL
jgi:D-sedoheptulose 7-phosphate isomerase